AAPQLKKTKNVPAYGLSMIALNKNPFQPPKVN
ncbi:MAG: hypothetical protein ACJAS1_002909, partial [Oleiphilaceae bacterium]